MMDFSLASHQNIPGVSGAMVKILGIGGAGCNVIDRMAMEGIEGLEVLTLNTDSRALMNGVSPDRIQLGAALTRGLGSGGDPDVGLEAARESAADVRASLVERKLVFLCAGLGGGTGSGAAPEIARIAREAGAVVVAFATLPFSFEGRRRVAQARDALALLYQTCDAVIVFENDRMGEVALATDGVEKAFEAADKLIGQSIRSVATIVTCPGLIRIGLDDLLSVLRPSGGHCLFGHGKGEGENRAKESLDKALRSPLLNRGRLLDKSPAVLVHITGGEDLRLFEVQTLMHEVARHINPDTRIFFGMAVDKGAGTSLSVALFSPLSDSAPAAAAAPAVIEEADPPARAAPDPVPAPAPTPVIEPRRLSKPPPLPSSGPMLFPDSEFTAPAPQASGPAAEPDTRMIEPVETPSPSPEAEAAFGEPANNPPDSNDAPAWRDSAFDPDADSPTAPPHAAPEPLADWSEPASDPWEETAPKTDDPAPAPVDVPRQDDLVHPPAEEPEEAFRPRTVLPELQPRLFVAEPEPAPVATPADPARDRSTPVPVPVPPARGLDSLVPADGAGQRELQLGGRDQGGKFDKAEPTMMDGEDLDVPAFLRRKRR